MTGGVRIYVNGLRHYYHDNEKISEVVNKIPFHRWSQLRFRYVVLSFILILLLWLSCRGDSYDEPSSPNPIQQDRILVVYSYDEAASKVSKDNVLYFLRHGVNPHADYALVITGPHTLDLETMFTFPPAPPVTQRVNNPAAEGIALLKTFDGRDVKGNQGNKASGVRRIYHRPSEDSKSKKCFRLGAFSEVLMLDNRDLLKSYRKFVFLDSSLRGPFLPSYSRDCWQDIYAGLLSSPAPPPPTSSSTSPNPELKAKDSNIKFVGNGVKCNYTAVTSQPEDEFGDDSSLSLSDPQPTRRRSPEVTYSISSSLFAVSRPALSYLLRHGPLNTCPGSKDALAAAEASIPTTLQRGGYGVTSHIRGVELSQYCEAEEGVGVGGGTGGDRGIFRTYEQEDGEEERLTGWSDIVGIGMCDGKVLAMGKTGLR